MTATHDRQQARRTSLDFDIMLPAFRRAAESMIGDDCARIPDRLRVAGRAFKAVAAIPKLQAVASELDGAATALEHSRSPAPLSALASILRIPMGRVYANLPHDRRGGWHLLQEQLAVARESLRFFEGAAWLASAGPSRAARIALLASGDEQLSADFGVLASRACTIAGSALRNAGVALLGVSRQLDTLVAASEFFDFCEDDCVLGRKRGCVAGKVTFSPFGDADTDSADFDAAITFLKVLSWTPKVPLSPGGAAAIREIVKGLNKIKEATDKLKKDLAGYSVFVQLTYEECDSGLCGTYWNERTKVVAIDPPAGKKHQLGKGWKQSIIDDLGKNEQATADQLNEFMQLAEKKCP